MILYGDLPRRLVRSLLKSHNHAHDASRESAKGKPPYAPPLVLLVFSIFAMAAGFGFYRTGSFIMGRHLPIYSWPSTKGRVVKSCMVFHIKYSETMDKEYFLPSILYTYAVNGNEYQSQRQRYRGTPVYESRERAEKVLAKYRKHPEVTVYYDPSNPARAVIVRRAYTKTGWILRVGGVVVFVFGLLALGAGVVIAFRERSLKQQKTLV